MHQSGCVLCLALIFELASLVDARFSGALQNSAAPNSLRGSPADPERPQSMNMFDSMHIFDARSEQIQPLDVALNFNHLSFSNAIPSQKLVTSIAAASVLLVLACLICVCLSGGNAEPGLPSSKLKDVDDAADRSTVQSAWSRAYSEAKGEEKEALEMLFRCNIISTEEFASSTVTQDHIQECTWIAVHMLRHKPMEEWAGSWQQAQQNFESSVVECFEQSGGKLGLTGRAIAQRLKIKRNQRTSPSQDTSMPSSANLDFVSLDAIEDLRPLHS